MKKFYLNFLVVSLLVLATQISSQAQNLIVNSDFEKDGGSLNGWGVASGTTLGVEGTDHYVVMHGENGVLYQKITGITVGKTYKCTMYFKNLVVKQNTGYGYAIEKDTVLVLPEFTIGATNLKNFCGATGEWTVLESNLAAQNVSMEYDVMIPDSTTAIYICLGTKGAVSDMQVDSVIFKESLATSASVYANEFNKVISVYPVPARNEVTLEFKNTPSLEKSEYTVVIYDQIGKMIRNESSSIMNGKIILSVQDLKSGLYFIQIPEFNGRAKMVVSY